VIAVSRGVAANGGARDWDLATWRSPAELNAVFSGAQAIVHAGAMVHTSGPTDEQRMFDTNVRASLNLGHWAMSRNVPVVHVSSASVYADTMSEGLREDALLGWSGLGGFYGLTKLLAEDLFARLRQCGLNCAIVRPSSLYGFGLPADKMISRFSATARDGGVISLIPPVDDRVDLIHAADVSRAIVAILEAEAWDTFNIASGRPASIKDVADACVSATGRGRVVISDGRAPERGPITRFALDSGRAHDRLGWRPQVDIERGVRMMVRECVHGDETQNVANLPNT
jgi:UDP-glucose 4-epimerase